MFIVPISPMKPLESILSTEASGKLNEQPKSSAFSDVLKGAIENLRETQSQSSEDAYNLAVGDMDNLAQLMINSAKAEAALTMAVQVTSRAVNTYKEIVQMQL